MKFNQYNNTYIFIYSVIGALLAFICPIQRVSAQVFSSRQQRSDFERFEQLRTTNRDSAYFYANRIASDVDSTVMSQEVAMIFDFMAEYSETRLHRYTKALEYREHSARIYKYIDDHLYDE